jgi:hypothetical protein
MKAYGRHGDLSFFVIDTPADLTGYVDVDSPTLAGSHGGAHVVSGPCKLKRENVTDQLLIVLADATVRHADRHTTKPLPARAYLVRAAVTTDGIVED